MAISQAEAIELLRAAQDRVDSRAKSIYDSAIAVIKNHYEDKTTSEALIRRFKNDANYTDDYTRHAAFRNCARIMESMD